MIKVIITDGDGALGFPNVETAKSIVHSLANLSIQLVVATNDSENSIVARFRNAGLHPPELIVTPQQIGKRKPSPDYVFAVQSATGVEMHEIAYLGDDDKTDTLCAINAKVLPLTAKYSTADKPREYGIPIRSPQALTDYLSVFCRQSPPYFGWEYKSTCSETNTSIDMRALFGQHKWFSNELKTVLKNQTDVFLGSQAYSLMSLLLRHLVTQMYLSGLTAEMDYVTVYPGHKATSHSDLLAKYLEIISQSFRTRFLQDLLVRHQTAPKSQHQGNNRNIYDQFRTIHVNPQYRQKIRGKSIIVLDDFTTYGFSLETARRMLLNAQAKMVTGLSIAKYRNEYSTTSVKKAWDPFAPATLTPDEIHVLTDYGVFNQSPDDHFRNKVWPFYAK